MTLSPMLNITMLVKGEARGKGVAEDSLLIFKCRNRNKRVK